MAALPGRVGHRGHGPDEAAGRALRQSLTSEAADRLLLFFGQLDYAPNRQAVRDLIRRYGGRWIDR